MLSHIVADVYKKSEFSGCSVYSVAPRHVGGNSIEVHYLSRPPQTHQLMMELELTVMNVAVLGVIPD